jgi:hypothetical protein
MEESPKDLSGCNRCLGDLVEEDHGSFFYYYCPVCKAYRKKVPKEEG